jgi:SARP family transcriptional regulator, regulator of embCAB operon
VRYSVLGHLELVDRHDNRVDINGKRVRALLSILVLHANRVVPLEQILDGIWPDNPPRSAIANVRTYVCQLRSIIANADGRADGADPLESKLGGYRLGAAAGSVDFQCFESLAERGHERWANGFAAEAAQLLGEALDLWRGDPLPDIELGLRVRAKTIALEERRWETYATWLNARFACGQRQGLSTELQEALGKRPLDEGLWAALMGALHASGRTVDALQAYTHARNLLGRELGTTPGPALRAAHRAVLRGERVTSLVPYCQPGVVV